MKKVTVALLFLMLPLIFSLQASAEASKRFLDVDEDAWYYNAVEYAAENGLFAGTGDGKFSPEMPMTRGMFVTVLGRQARVSSEKPRTTSFNDVAPGAYYAPFVEWAAGNSIVSGKGGGLFGPNDPLTREQMVTILHRYAEVAGLDLSTGRTTLDAYLDKSQIAGYAQQAMTWAVAHHIVGGADGKLLPKAEATRAQVAQVFLNAKGVLKTTGEQEVNPSTDSVELRELKRLVAQRLPVSCQWDERALRAGWYGPMSLSKNGSLENIADGCIYLLTKLDGITYDVYYITEGPKDSFTCYYG